MQLMSPADSAMHFPLSKAGQQFKANNSSRYMEFINILSSTPTTKILQYILGGEVFPHETEEEMSVLPELFRAVIKSRHNWDDADVENALKSYVSSQQAQYNRPQVKTCSYCGADMTETFALALTADNLISGEVVMCQCPACQAWNYFKAKLGGYLQ